MCFSQHILMPGMQTVQPQIQQTNVQQQQPNIQSQLSQLNQSQIVLQGSNGTINVLGQTASGQVNIVPCFLSVVVKKRVRNHINCGVKKED